MLLRTLFNNYLDNLIRPQIHLGHKSWPTFQLCGYIGLASAALLAMILVIYLELSPWMMTGITLVAVSILLGLTMVTKIISGKERIINYHHQITVLVVTTLLLWLLNQPILPYLEITMLGVGLFIACGRIGCLMNGCCHGRPHGWGVCYRNGHSPAGLTPCFVGIRLFPIQAVESLWVFFIVLVGSIFVLAGQPPGTALGWYLLGYSAGRFFFEFLRGDTDRANYGGFSEAQWTAIILTALVVTTEIFRLLPFYKWHVVVAVLLMMSMIGVVLYRHLQKDRKHQLLHPNHIKEVAEALERLSRATRKNLVASQSSASEDIHVERTSLDVQISASKIKKADGYVDYYALSYQSGVMSERVAYILAKLILQLRQPSASSEIIKGNSGVYHLLIHS